MQRLHNPVKCTFFFWRILIDKIFKTSCVCLYGFTFHIVQFVIINYLLKKTHRTQMCKCALSLKITSATKWQLLNFFILYKNYVSLSRYSSFCVFNHPMIYRIHDVTSMSIMTWVLVHETGCIFEYMFWTTTHEVTKLSQLTDICEGNNFQ